MGMYMHQGLLRAILLIALSVAFAGRATAGALEAAEAFKQGDYAGVLSACQAAAKAGDASCQNYLGVLYSDGKGVKEDQAQAVHWFRLAADQGNAAGACNLGYAYETGEGVAKDLQQAEKWYQVAAEKGLALAQARLGLILITQHKDWKSGLKLIRTAAAQGEPIAEDTLAIAYQSGN